MCWQKHPPELEGTENSRHTKAYALPMAYLSWIFREENWPSPVYYDLDFARSLRFPTEDVPISLAIQLTTTREQKDVERIELLEMGLDEDWMTKPAWSGCKEMDEATVEELKVILKQVDPQDEFLTAFRKHGTMSLSRRIVTRETHPHHTEEQLVKRQQLEDKRLRHRTIMCKTAEKIYEFQQAEAKWQEEQANVIRQLEELDVPSSEVREVTVHETPKYEEEMDT